MNSMIEQRATRRPHTIVLLARLVDRDGDAIAPADIRSIECTVRRLDCGSECAGCRRCQIARGSLPVSEVILDDLRHAGDWTESGEPFNFRHEFPAPSGVACCGAGARYEIQYLVTKTTGERTLIRFRIRNGGYDGC